METSLQLTVAKLELKQMEVIEKLSEKHNDYVIRVIQSSVTDKFVMLNGDWELITGFKEIDCVGMGWEKIIPMPEVPKVFKHISDIKKHDNFDCFTTKLIIRDKKVVSVNWKGKYFPEINGLVFIGRVKRS
jgi:hypothetical protein